MRILQHGQARQASFSGVGVRVGFFSEEEMRGW